MGTITLPNFRTTADVTMNTRLKDGGVYIDWTALTDIKAWLYSDAQKAIAGRCTLITNELQPNILVCEYSATKPQYLGVQRLIVQAKYMGRTKTYDKPVFNFVPRTADQEGTQIVIDDPEVDVEIEVEDVSSSLIERLIAACIKATEEAKDVVDVHRGPQGLSAYEVAVENGFEGTEEEWLDSLVGPEGPEGPQGEQGIPGETGTPGVTSAVVSVDDSTGEPSADASVENGVLSIDFSGLKGEQGVQGEQGIQGIQGPTGATGPQGKSAYQVAVDEGYEGTEEEWLATLVGPQGPQGIQGIQGIQGPQGIQGETGPKGETGATGATGAQGPQGETGATPEFSIGTVQTGAAGSQASASIGGTAAAPVLNLVIPKGDQGNTGSSVAFPFTLANNTHTADPEQGLSAEMGKYLQDQVSWIHEKFMLLFESLGNGAFWGTKPDIDFNVPYTRVEYIETDGVAYINTGVNGNAVLNTEVKLTPKKSTGFATHLGCRNGNDRFLPIIQWKDNGGQTYDNYISFGYAGASSAGLNMAQSLANETPLVAKTHLEGLNCTFGIKQAGESSFTTTSTATAGTITTNLNVFLFANNWDGVAKENSPLGTRVHYCKILNSANTILFDGIPCIYEGEYGLWDRVTDSFFGNSASSGAFTGPQI